MPIYPLQDSFTRGEVSPKLRGRPTLQFYRSALAECVNFDIQPQGGLRKRLGTRYVASAMGQTGKVRLIPFEPDTDNTYAIEFSETKLRTLRNGTIDAALSENGSSLAPLITHNFTDIEAIKYEQSNDVIWLVDGAAGKTLSRTENSVWKLDDMEFLDGPFDDQNTDKTKTLQASGTSGTVTLTATGFTFAPAIVGSVIRLEEVDRTYAPTWVNDGTRAVGDQVRYVGNVYEVETAHSGSANVIAPTHIIGSEELDSSGTRRYKYLHSGYGYAKVTAFVSTTELTCEIISNRPYEDQPEGHIPKDIEATGTYLWSLPMFFEGSGPVAVKLYQERLILSKGNRVFMSRVGNFKSFRTGTNPDDAIEVEATSGAFNEIYALDAVNGYLIAVGKSGIQRFSAGSDGPIAPGDIFQRQIKRRAMSKIQPLQTDESLFLFPSPALSVYEAAYSQEQGGFLTPDATIMSDHLFKLYGTIIAGAVSRGSVQTAIFPTANGNVITLVYDKYQQVSGWSRRDFGGRVLAATSVSGALGQNDYYIVEREVEGVTQRFVEYVKHFEGQEYGGYQAVSGTDAEFLGVDENGLSIAPANVDAERDIPLHLDCAVLSSDVTPFPDGARVTWASGVRSGTGVVVSGAVANAPVDSWVGLPFTARAQTLPVEIGRRGDGADSGRPQRVSRVVIDVMGSAGVEVIAGDKPAYVLGEREDDFDNAVDISRRDGSFDAHVDGSWQDRGQVTIRAAHPFPAYIRNLTPVVD